MALGISKEDKNGLIEAIRNSGCITYGERTSASGQKLYYFVDLEKLTDDNGADSLYLARAMASLIETDEKNKGRRYTLLGVKGGGFKVAKHTKLFLDRDVIGINPHDGSIDKILTKTESYAFVEDVTTTGGSIEKCFRLTSSLYDVRPKVAFSVVDRNQGAIERLEQLGIRIDYAIDAKFDLGLINTPHMNRN